MIKITIRPATRSDAGFLRVEGHAEHKDVCGAVTALVEGLAANLLSCWDIKTGRRAEPGDYGLTWIKTDRAGRGLSRANTAAGVIYTALRALAEEWPKDVEVHKVTPGFRRYGEQEEQK